LNIIDDFKTNLLWLSTFIVRSAEGMSMRMPVNCRPVLQSNCFKAEEGKETKNMLEAVHEPDGDTFQNSPLKLVFYKRFVRLRERLAWDVHNYHRHGVDQ
jgi:hypothetical protein